MEWGPGREQKMARRFHIIPYSHSYLRLQPTTQHNSGIKCTQFVCKTSTTPKNRVFCARRLAAARTLPLKGTSAAAATAAKHRNALPTTIDTNIEQQQKSFG